MKFDEIDVLALAVLRDLQQVQHAQKPRRPRYPHFRSWRIPKPQIRESTGTSASGDWHTVNGHGNSENALAPE